jgi:outer membrane lipoprotein-sorting protein
MRRINIALLVLAFAVLGCKLPAALSGAGSGSTGSSKGTATGGSDPREDVVQASKKFIALPSFTANMEGVGQTEIKSQVAYAAPDKYHVKYLGGTGAGMEIIFIGSQMYMKTGDKWSKMPSAQGTSIPTLRDSFTEEGLKSLTDVKYEGTDSVNGEPAALYSYKNVTPAENYPFTSKIWISENKGLPMKIYVEYSNGMLKNMTVNYDVDSPVTIDAPIK